MRSESSVCVLIRLFDKPQRCGSPALLSPARFFSLDYRVLREIAFHAFRQHWLRPVSLKRATIAAVVAQRIRRSGIDDDIRQDHDERVVAHDRTSNTGWSDPGPAVAPDGRS